MLTLRDIIFAVGLPAVWTGVVLLIAWRPWRVQGLPPSGFWSGPVALAGSFLWAFLGASGPPQFPPIQVTDWLPFIAVVAAVIGLADSTLEIPRGVKWATGCLCIALATWMLIRPLPAETHSQTTKLSWLAMRAIVWGGCWIAIERQAIKYTGSAIPRDLLIVTSATALVLVMSASKLLGLLAGSLAASLAVFVAVGYFTSLSMARGSVLVLLTLLSGLLICGLFYAFLSRPNALLLLLSVVLTALSRLGRLGHLQGWKRHSVQLAFAAIPAVIAVILAVTDFAASMSEGSGDYGY